MKKRTTDLWVFSRAVISGFRRDDCFNFAAVISFYAVFSVLPIVMTGVGLLAFALGSSGDFLGRFELILDGLVPGASRILLEIVQTVLRQKEQFSFISIGILILIASLLFTALERSLDRVFRTSKSRNFFHSRIIAIGFIFLFILLFAAPGLLGLVQKLLVFVPEVRDTIPRLLAGDRLFFFVAFMAFILSVTVIPNHKVLLRYSAVGGIFFTVLTGLARWLFRWYVVASWSRYNLIYGSLTFLIILMVWIFYLANIYLMSAQVVARLQEKSR